MTFRRALLALLFCAPMAGIADDGAVHVTWLIHNHQPIYYPDERLVNDGADFGDNNFPDHYQNAWDTISAQASGQSEPSDVSLEGVFDDGNRPNVYQVYPHDAVSDLSAYSDGGIQLNMSGALMENVQSLADAGQFGYFQGWNTASTGPASVRTWLTATGKPRLDMVNFCYHHAFAALVTDATLQMELEIHQRQMQLFWNISGSNPPISNGYFPTECAFSERMIPILSSMGITWSVVSGEHLTRTCPDAPFVFGNSSEMCEPPNAADQLAPSQGGASYQTFAISRGCAPMSTAPYSFQAHLARYVDPATGNASTITVVPSDQAMSWTDGYEQWNLTGYTDNGAASIQQRNNPSDPGIVLLCHDGDNAFADGYTYWEQSIASTASQASGAGYWMTTVQSFLANWQPTDVVHVEDGAWVFADGDFGSPSFVNWNWPPSYTGANGKNIVDPSQGVSAKADFWRCVLATENRVRTAQQVSGITPRVDQVRDPGSFSATPNAVELGWHYYLAGLDSGFVYYGAADDEKRAVISQQNAMREVDSTVNAGLANDTTAPSVFLPQRFPWNPGGRNYGVQYNYTLTTATNTDFWIWTYAYDASGMGGVVLKYRSNGSNGAPTQDEYKTYAGGADTGPWQSIAMTDRSVSSSLQTVPQYQADYYYAKVTGLSNSYVDYYVTAWDSKGNTYNSPIQHVFVSNAAVSIPPAQLTVVANPANGGSVSGGGLYSVGSSGQISATANSGYTFTQWNDGGTQNPRQVTVPSGGVTYTAEFSATTSSPTPKPTPTPTPTPTPAPGPTPVPFVLTGTANNAYLLSTSGGMNIYAVSRGTQLYVATWSPGSNGVGLNDHFIFVTDQLLTSATATPPWGKAGAVAVASSKPYLGGESTNTFVGWFNAPNTSTCDKAPTNAGNMEGVIDLNAAFGYTPQTVYVAAAAYQTQAGGVLAAQGPAGNGDGNIDPGDFLAVPVVAVTDQLGLGVFDWLNPSMAFAAKFSTNVNGNPVITWPSIPGKTYQVQSNPTLSGTWQSVGSQVTAGAGQISVSATDSTQTIGGAGLFYRVMLVSP